MEYFAVDVFKPEAETEKIESQQVGAPAYNNSAQRENTDYLPWVIAGVFGIVILVSLFYIVRKLNKKN